MMIAKRQFWTRFVTRYLSAYTPSVGAVDDLITVRRMHLLSRGKTGKCVVKPLRKNQASLTSGMGIAAYDWGITRTS